MFAQMGLLKRLTGLLYFPITPTFPHFGLLGMLGYLPAKFKIRFLEPIELRRGGPARGQGARADRRARGPRADPGEPLGHARASASRSGSDERALARASSSPACPPTGAAGSPRRSRRSPRSRRSSASTTRSRTSSSSAPSTSRSAPSTRCCAGWSRRPRSTRSSTPGWSSTRPRPARAQGAREQRDRDDEHPGRLQRAPTRRCARWSSSRSTHYYGCEQDDPAFFDETMGRPHPPRTPIERDIVEAEASVDDFAEKNPDVDVTILRFANVLGPDVRHLAHRPLLAAGGADDPRLRPALPVRPRGRRGARARARGQRHRCRASTTSRATACWR